MGPDAEDILRQLQAVATLRATAADSAALAARVVAVKRFQQARFAHTYADLAAQPRYAAASRFFLQELYGAGDFTRRDAEFARIVPALVRLFPNDVVQTVRGLAQLHALSERLDLAMAEALATSADSGLRVGDYGAAWRHVGEPASRQRQIDLMLAVGHALDRLTHNPLLRHSLRLMRKPAQAAGLGALQQFLESGFETFRAMGGAAEFLETIAVREAALAEHLFSGGDPPANA